MRTHIVIDDKLMKEALRATGAKTRREAVELLDGLFGRTPLVVGDLIVAEVLQGIPGEREFNLVRKTLDAFSQIDLAGHDIALKAARSFRALRAQGITVRKTIDSIIATRCIEDGYTTHQVMEELITLAD